MRNSVIGNTGDFESSISGSNPGSSVFYASVAEQVDASDLKSGARLGV